MAVTVTLDAGSPYTVGTVLVATGSMAFDSSYSDGGESINAQAFGMSWVDHISLEGHEGYLFEVHNSLPASSVNVRVFCPTGGARPSSVAAPSVAVPSGGTTVTSSAAQPDLTETGGRGVEIADTADVSSLAAVRFTVHGV